MSGLGEVGLHYLCFYATNSLSIFILRTGRDVSVVSVPTCPVSRVTCPRVTTCHGPARTAAKGGCCTVDIFTSTPITTLDPVHCICVVAGCNV